LPAVEYPKFRKPILLSANTINQREALRPLIEHFQDRLEIITERTELFLEFEGAIILHSMPTKEQVEALALNSSSSLLAGFFTLRGFIRNAFLRRFYNIFKPFGQYHFLHKAFEKSPRPKLYIASNDHSGLSQVGFLVANELRISTLYLQHASVSEKFPPLSVTYALLEGQDAAEKYAAAGHSHTQVTLVGTMKYDNYLNKALSEPIPNQVGVAIGPAFVDYDAVYSLCRSLDHQNMQFTVRFHPGVADQIKNPFLDQKWEQSNPNYESALDFIMRCGTIISGDSNILLETIALNRRPIYFASTGESIDYYGFCKNGIVEPARLTSNEVLIALREPYDPRTFRPKAERYIAFLNGREADQAGRRVIDKVEGLLNQLS